MNLINNAFDAMEGHDDPVVHVSIEGTTVHVRDTGPGIDTELSEQMFDPFFTTKVPGKGLGLGLSITYNIVKDFGGTLTAENHPDGGAVFSVRLRPAAQTDMAAQ